MARFILKGSMKGLGLQALCVAEAPSKHDAVLWGYRHLSKVPGFTGQVEDEDAYLERTHGQFVESFRARYASEGASEEEAQRMAEAAAGARPVLRVVQVEAQAPMPRSSATPGREGRGGA